MKLSNMNIKKECIEQSFSSAVDFAKVLAIPVAAFVYYLVSHYFEYKDAIKIVDSDSFSKFYAYETGLWVHFFSFSLLIFGLGSAITLLHMIDRLKRSEEMT